MATIGTHTACTRLISSEVGKALEIIDFYLEANMSSDKEVGRNIHEGRGTEVMAWGTITSTVCWEALGASAERIYNDILTGQDGAIRNGQIGYNINAANVVAAMFIACGQDASKLTSEYNRESDEPVLTLYFPAMIVGNVGAGTEYPTQSEALDMIQCFCAGKTIAAFAMALDLSTVSAIATDTFSESPQVIRSESESVIMID